MDSKPTDPNDPATFNRYVYANNNPYKFVDPDGRSSCANTNCSLSTIDASLPRQGNTPATVTFVNDNPDNPSPNQPISTQTANMVESAIINSGADSVNINSTTGGKHEGPNHPEGRAVDINKINGAPVNASNAGALQNAAANEPNIRENFGPSSNTKKNSAGAAAVDKTTAVGAGHRTHVHLSGQE